MNYSRFISMNYLCESCSITAANALELAREVTLEIPKGGRQLYIAVERTGQETELLSVHRWSPLEPLEYADSAIGHLDTYPLHQA